MNKRRWMALAIVLLLAGVAGFYNYQRYCPRNSYTRADLLGMMPRDANAVLFADFRELRTAPLIAQLFALAPQPLQPDKDYAPFLGETGFHYERDLDHLAIAFEKSGQDSSFFAVAEGRFDRQRISALALKSGTAQKQRGREILAVPESDGKKEIYFTFLSNERIALTDQGDLAEALSAKKHDHDSAEWSTRFDRLAGSPIFAVIRKDASPGKALSSRAPGGSRSPPLSRALDQFEWITLAGKPENDRLRIAAEGECASEETTRQLADLLNGVLVLAESGLNDAKTRQQLDPALREAYLTLLKGVDVSKLDRGDTKSVRLVFEITRGFLESARRSFTGVGSSPPNASPAKPAPRSAVP
ncbi:MAG TPA: hypothetical protein VNB49_16615, partial [Candidatus Dormibacteraeota bacterium]|nr:hypothetical protein [Candidatus Dormibacteraeota bacterium]